ncbi:hypothetical protein PDIG_37930 [Penicillium digitatum PHI26]|uniref:Uncharacterized protein n=2 Tax=Penicillium digitatum TaxID=36651 RepID=K9FWU9_PEND2|nr:hypothetical protein PDIP_84510 [Penicillium digitatum Pd1]EKV05089.1 hypothetical protein PDIP_84510 [Penicillium digitatum Pd1]EKV13604.1 hypothetical protein PDIG_37930 [Penicillium digitatum PHI26]
MRASCHCRWGAHIQATVYAIAEKAAELIIDDYFARMGPL